jgi:hypothetical protein
MSHGARYGEYGWWGTTVLHIWVRILAVTNQSEQEGCHGVETYLQCTISQDIFTSHLPAYVSEHLCRNVDSQFASVDKLLMHYSIKRVKVKLSLCFN